MRAMHIDLSRKEKCKVTLDDVNASYLTFILTFFFFFFSMITSSTAHEKSYPTWRRKGIDDFLCVNANAWRNIYVISPVYLLSPLTHIIITLDFLRLALLSYNCKIREHNRGLSRFLVLVLRRGIVFLLIFVHYQNTNLRRQFIDNF